MANTTNHTSVGRLQYASERIPNRVFYIPFAYLYHVRLGTLPKLLAWAVIYIVPTAVYSALLAHDLSIPLWQTMWTYLLLLVIVFTTYESGYIYNDTLLTRKETNPTIRLYDYNLEHFFNHYHIINITRATITILAWLGYIMAMPHFPAKHFLFIVIAYFAIPLLFTAYNRNRTIYNVFIYPLLVFSRYFVFLVPYFQSSLMTIATISLFVCFPLCNAIERFSMPRHRFPLIRTLIPTEQSKTLFRVGYYVILLVILAPILYSLYPVRIASTLLSPIVLITLMRLLILIVTRFHQPKNYLRG